MSRQRRLLLFVAVLSVMVAVTPLAGAQEKVQIQLWHHWALTDLIEEILANFEAEYPWIEVEHAFSSTAGAQDRLGTLLVSGVAPEVLMVRSTYAFPFMSMGGFYPLDELAARDGIDLGIFNPGDLRSFQFQGKTYAFPSMSGSAWTNLMFYNKDMMDNAGLDSERPPQTWADWRTATLRMTQSDDGGLTQLGSQIPLLSQAVAWNGTQYWSEDWTKAQAVTPEAIETAEFMRDVLLDAYGAWGAYNTLYAAGASFWEGRLGFYFTNNSGFGNAKRQADFRWGAATAPVNSNNPNARPVNVVSSTWSYAIPSTISDDKLEAAWLLLKYLTTNEDGGGYFARWQGRPSPVIEFNRHPDYMFDNPYWHVVLEALQYEITAPPGVTGKMDAAGTAVFTGQKHPQQALADADVQIQLELDNYWSALDQ